MAFAPRHCDKYEQVHLLARAVPPSNHLHSQRTAVSQFKSTSFIMPSCFVSSTSETLTGEGPHRMAMKANVLPLSHRCDEILSALLFYLPRSFSTGYWAGRWFERTGWGWRSSRARASLAFFPRPPTANRTFCPSSRPSISLFSHHNHGSI